MRRQPYPPGTPSRQIARYRGARSTPILWLTTTTSSWGKTRFAHLQLPQCLYSFQKRCLLSSHKYMTLAAVLFITYRRNPSH